ncbi:pectinesterase inhibitor 10-like protein [Tanacetum coccineum]
MNRPGSKDFRLVVSDIQTWVSSAMTDEDTCSEGFANDKKIKGVVRGKLVNVMHLTSNALALINNYASISSVHGPKLLAQTALSVALDTSCTTSSSMVKLAEVHGMSLREISAMKDCIELLGDSVYELKQSLDKMTYPGSKGSGLVMSDIQTWVSSAMKDEETCLKGLRMTLK